LWWSGYGVSRAMIATTTLRKAENAKKAAMERAITCTH
jgi:hypothetical protein